MRPQWSKWLLYGLMEMTHNKGLSEVVIYNKENQPHYIRTYYGCYDPLAYPMFNPNGETGWEDKKILYQDSPPSKPKRKYTKRVQKGGFICYLDKQ